MKLASIIESPLRPGPEANLANTLGRGLGNNYFNIPRLSRPDATVATDREPTRKTGTPKKRRHRKFFHSNNEQPGA